MLLIAELCYAICMHTKEEIENEIENKQGRIVINVYFVTLLTISAGLNTGYSKYYMTNTQKRCILFIMSNSVGVPITVSTLFRDKIAL